MINYHKNKLETMKKLTIGALLFISALNIVMFKTNSSLSHQSLMSLETALADDLPEVTITCNSPGLGYCSYLLCSNCGYAPIYDEECYCFWTGNENDYCDPSMECDCGDC